MARNHRATTFTERLNLITDDRCDGGRACKGGRGVQALIAFTIRPLGRDVIRGFKTFALAQPEVLAVYVLGGSDDFLVHVAMPTIADMHALLMDRFSKRKEVIGFRTSIIYEHTRNVSIEPVGE